jgi:hypothetical protein
VQSRSGSGGFAGWNAEGFGRFYSKGADGGCSVDKMPQRINELRKHIPVIAFGVLLPLPKTETYAAVRIFGFKKQHLIHESDLFFERRENLIFSRQCRILLSCQV